MTETGTDGKETEAVKENDEKNEECVVNSGDEEKKQIESEKMEEKEMKTADTDKQVQVIVNGKGPLQPPFRLVQPAG